MNNQKQEILPPMTERYWIASSLVTLENTAKHTVPFEGYDVWVTYPGIERPFRVADAYYSPMRKDWVAPSANPKTFTELGYEFLCWCKVPNLPFDRIIEGREILKHDAD